MNRRRNLLKGLITLPLATTLSTEQSSAASPIDFERDYFKELGVRTFINAAGTYTALTASLPHHEVVKAINYAALQFAKLEDLLTFVLRDLARNESNQLDAQEQDIVEQRLRELGYL